jgi:hypothetical protein
LANATQSWLGREWPPLQERLLRGAPLEVYQNIVDLTLSDEDALACYYAENLQRLRTIKGAVDPEYYFHFPQSIAPLTLGELA